MQTNGFPTPPLLGLFNDCFPPIMDGVSVTTRNYAYWLHRKTGNACVVTPRYPLYRDTEPYPVYRYSSLPIPLRKPYRMGFPRIDWTFTSRLSRLPFGLVHAHCPFSSGNLAMRIARTRGIPLVATFHSKYRADFERVIPNKYIVDHILTRIIRFYEQADEVWIPQASVEETLREYGYKGRVEVIDNGNDLAVGEAIGPLRRQARQTLGIGADEPVFLFVGQHIWEKNIAFLLDALTDLGDLPYRMFFIGCGYAEKEIRQLAGTLRLSRHITFTGPVTRRETLKQYYAAADLFLFPSRYDNAPLVVREAAALETPSLLLEGSTAAQIIRNGVNGYLSPAHPEAYAQQIRQLIARPEALRQAGREAARTIARPWSEIIEEVLDRYTHLIRRKCPHLPRPRLTTYSAGCPSPIPPYCRSSHLDT